MILQKRLKSNHRLFLMNLALATCFGGSCKSTAPAEQAQTRATPPMRIDEPGHPDDDLAVELDTQLGEVLFNNEAASTTTIIDSVSASIKKVDSNIGNRALRDAHPKAHGCVQAEFKINDDIPADLAKGAFQKGAKYPAWIRFSNGNSDSSIPDIAGDARGMAIKLMNVPGDKIFTDDEKNTQDFVMISNPTFPSNDPAKYQLVIAATLNQKTHPLKAGQDAIMGLEPGSISSILHISTKKIPSPLKAQYWSMVPYRLGSATDPQKAAIKFSAIPCKGEDIGPTSFLNVRIDKADFLKDEMAKALDPARGKDACFNFAVQVKKGTAMNVEDSITEWSTKESPFINVATITIPKQIFRSPAQEQFCDNLSYTPWHALPDHKPLGAVNRVRKPLYKTISKLRHEINGNQQMEPTGSENFQ